MAYNRPYDPDALPRFAEPDQKPGQAPSPHAGAPPQQRYDRPQQPQYQQQQPQYQQHQQPPPNQHQYDHPPRRDTAGHGGQGQYDHPPRRDTAGHGQGAYGLGSPPPVAAAQRPAAQHHPAATSRPPPSPSNDANGADPTLLPLFRAVDKDGTGHLSEKELSAALVNGDWTAFDIQTVRMMIRMFDSDRSGTIGFQEFCGLWSFLASWRTLFDRFDVDRSGNISLPEFTDALIAFRYRLSPQFVELLFRTYDKRGEGVMSFDLFVQACISLKRMTDVFKRYDDDRDGYITLSFEDFLSEILKQMK
ncbi:EF hand domain-containing protein [Trichoderma breve]|uniref:EF hand domain-containing protein n=1 Tax=Trichoderma breve TaxID=2034170 RepID=A0A9W9E8K8_9HYPO|nr:EF hand domain-containing protein [Trichoderma breve]KAJ4860527.1 EF hand domain-containing protein [Trichoderma breve]